MQDLLTRVGQAAEDLVAVGVADKRHRDDQRVRVMPAQRQRRRDDQLAPARQVLKIVVARHPLPEHHSDVLRVIHDCVRQPPVQLPRKCRLTRTEPAIQPDDHEQKVPGRTRYSPRLHPSCAAARARRLLPCCRVEGPSEWVEAALEQAELVAFWIGEDVPGRLRGLADVDEPGPGGQEALELGVLIAVGGVDVDVQPGVPVPRLVVADEDDRRLRAAEPFARAYLDEDLLFAIEL